MPLFEPLTPTIQEVVESIQVYAAFPTFSEILPGHPICSF